MRKGRFSETQIVGIVKEKEAGLAVARVCRKHGISRASLFKEKAKYRGMDVSDARRSLRKRRRSSSGWWLIRCWMWWC